MSGMVCPQCHHKRSQRKEIIQEITDTEINYGRDLNILKEVSRKLPIKTFRSMKNNDSSTLSYKENN